MLGGDLFTRVAVVKAELIAAVVAYGHGRWTEANDLYVVRVTAVAGMRVIAAVYGRQGRPHDRVRAVRTHVSRHRPRPEVIERFSETGRKILLFDYLPMVLGD